MDSKPSDRVILTSLTNDEERFPTGTVLWSDSGTSPCRDADSGLRPCKLSPWVGGREKDFVAVGGHYVDRLRGRSGVLGPGLSTTWSKVTLTSPAAVRRVGTTLVSSHRWIIRTFYETFSRVYIKAVVSFRNRRSGSGVRALDLTYWSSYTKGCSSQFYFYVDFRFIGSLSLHKRLTVCFRGCF